MDNCDTYQSPLVTRNASPEMSRLFGARHRILTWRRVWLALAESEAELGLPIKPRQLAQLRRTLETIDFDKAAEFERRLRHDVMAHLHAWGELAPQARGILHLGATSMDIVDNADLLILRDALTLIRDWLVNVIDALARFAKTWRGLPCLGYTHFQPAQLTTVGRRACLWCYDLVRDLHEIDLRIGRLRLRGIRGATGTQASFLALFGGDAAKVARLERLVARRLGFEAVEPVTGQTYTRKIDAEIAAALAGVAVSAHKFANDLRLLAGLKELEEPFEAEQVGSSAMPYKRNPMRCERITGLARLVLSLLSSPFQNAAEQWLERTLDDSSNKRITTPEAFLACDGILRLVTDVSRGLVVNEPVIAARVAAELPFIVTEEVLMAAAVGNRRSPQDRQMLHERLRRHSQAAAAEVKAGRRNDLLDRLAADPAFAGLDVRKAFGPARCTGLSTQQVDQFLKEVVRPILRQHRRALGRPVSLHV